MPGSCSSGFRSRPSGAAGFRRRNGLDVNSRNTRKPIETRPITASTRASIGAGRLLERSATASAQPVSISTHSSSEPSCEPHVAARRYASGSCELECCATFSTEKSPVAKLYARQPNANATSRNCAMAAGRANAISAASRRYAPTQRQRALRDRHQQRDDQREMSQLRNHEPPFIAEIDMPGWIMSRPSSWTSTCPGSARRPGAGRALPFCAASSAAAASGGM